MQSLPGLCFGSSGDLATLVRDRQVGESNRWSDRHSGLTGGELNMDREADYFHPKGIRVVVLKVGRLYRERKLQEFLAR